MCILSIKVPIRKSLKTYLMILVHIYKYIWSLIIPLAWNWQSPSIYAILTQIYIVYHWYWFYLEAKQIIRIYIYIYRERERCVRGIMFTVVGNGYGDPNSNSRWPSLRFTQHLYPGNDMHLWHNCRDGLLRPWFFQLVVKLAKTFKQKCKSNLKV